jgi:hypothetical protein
MSNTDAVTLFQRRQACGDPAIGCYMLISGKIRKIMAVENSAHDLLLSGIKAAICQFHPSWGSVYISACAGAKRSTPSSTGCQEYQENTEELGRQQSKDRYFIAMTS